VAHSVGGADQISERILPGYFLPQDAIFPLNMKFFDSALKQMPKDVDIYGLYEVVVRAGVDDFQGRRLGFIRTQNDDEGVDVPARQTFQQMSAFADSAHAVGEGQKQDIELGLLEQFVGSLIIVAFQNLEMRAQAGGDFRAQNCIIINDRDLWFRGNGGDG
jgi:hypothetical protein